MSRTLCSPHMGARNDKFKADHCVLLIQKENSDAVIDLTSGVNEESCYTFQILKNPFNCYPLQIKMKF